MVRSAMARLRLVRSDDPRALLAEAASAFLLPLSSDAPFPTPPHLLLLRQGGLRDDLLSLAAERGISGWFDPPIHLFQQIQDVFGSTDLTPCSDYERVVLLSRVIRENRGTVLAGPDAADFVDAVDRLFGELVAEAVSADAFAGALAARADRDAFEHNRDEDLSRCYRAYLEGLGAEGRRDGRDRLIDTARALASDPEALADRIAGRREVRIVGLQDLRGGWRLLLESLRASPVLDEIAIYTITDLEPALEGMPFEVEWIGPPDAVLRNLFAAGASTGSEARRLSRLSAPDSDRETEAVAQRVRALIETGVEPDRIAIVSRSARPYVDRMLDALALYAVPASARRRHAFAEIPVVRAVLALFAVASEGWTRHGLVELAEQPYFGRTARTEDAQRRLDPVVINHIGYRRRVIGLEEWARAHGALRDAALELEHRAKTGDDTPRRGRDTPPPVHRCEAALAAFTGFARKATELDRPRTLRSWLEWLQQFLDEDPFRIEARLYEAPSGRYDVARLDAAGLRGMRRIIAEWESALSLWGEPDSEMDVAAFEVRLREMLSGDSALWTPERRGVQVIEGLAAAQRAFDHVFIAGLAGDVFPLRAPRSPILGEADRRHLTIAGVPLDVRAVWEQRERDLFRALVAGARSSLTLSWPRNDAEGRELIPSAFIEELEIACEAAGHELAPVDVIPTSAVADASLPLVRTADRIDFAVHAAVVERIRSTGRLSAYNGQIQDDELRAWLASERLGAEYVWSATQLEAYAKCPWAWFSRRLLRLDDLDDPDIDMDPLVRGAVLHDALRRFYDGARSRLGGPVFLREADADWARAAIREALERAIDDAGSVSWLGAPALRDTKRAELSRMLVAYIEWEIEYNEKHFNRRSPRSRSLRTGVDRHELAFGSMQTPETGGDDEVLMLAGVEFRMRGSIDRVEVGIDDRVSDPGAYIAAIDYKSSTWSAPGGGSRKAWQDGVVLQVPLYARILERRLPGSRVARVEYRAIKQRQAVHSTELYGLSRDEQLESRDEAQQQMKLALETAGAQVARARAGLYPAAPAPSCGCPPFCHAWDICRVEGGPRTNW